MDERNSGAVLQTVENLSRIFQEQLGCSMRYAHREEISSANNKNLQSLLGRGEPVRVEDSIYFPVFFHEELAGAAHVVTTKQFEQHTLKHLHGVIRLMVENRLSQMERLEVLNELESNLLNQRESLHAIKAGNVLKIRNYQNNPYPLPENKINKALSFAFLLQSQDPEDIFKMALEIHSRSGRYAFLPLKDLSTDIFASPEAFKKLGAVTVFISDVTSLTPDQQAIFLLYYQGQRDQDCPQIVAGSSLGISQLGERVLPELLQYLSVGFLAMNKPFALYKSENLLEFFYDSLTGRTS